MPNCVLVIPCYNEAERLPVDAFRQFARRGHPVRFLLVNDGSTDATAAMLEALRHADPQRFDVLHLGRNRGKAEAVRQGILRALEWNPDAVGFWDADLATPLAAIPAFLQALDSDPRRQWVLGARVRLLGRSIQRRRGRHYLGRAFAMAASTVLGLPIYDTQCGAKLFRAGPELRQLFGVPFRSNWIFDVELLARLVVMRRARRAPAPATALYELPLSRWSDVAGSKVRPRDFFKAIGELAVIYWTYLRPHATAAVFLETGAARAENEGQPPPPHNRRRAA